MSYNGWKISDNHREWLLDMFPPKHPDVIAHHVTNNLTDMIPDAAKIRIIGYAANHGVECFIVEVNGNPIRPDGKIYHITWSIDRAQGFKPVHSNDLIKDGFTSINPIEIDTIPFKVIDHMEYFQ